MATYQPIFNTFDKKPVSQALASPGASFGVVLRDHFTLPTWLIIGAFLQGLLTLLPYPNLALLAPAALYLFYHTTLTLLQTFNILPNPYMKSVIQSRHTPILPTPTNPNPSDPGAQPVCTLHIGARSNHPLGIFAPGFQDLGNHMNALIHELDSNATKHNFLGANSWISACERGHKSELMTIMYFRTAADVQAFAHGEMHSETLRWWSRNAAKWPHLAIMHEFFAAPAGGWEAVFLNSHPTGMGATAVEVGQGRWRNPLVVAKGKLLYSKGRQGVGFEEKGEWAELEEVIAGESGYFPEK